MLASAFLSAWLGVEATGAEVGPPPYDERFLEEVVFDIPPALCPGRPQPWEANGEIDPLPAGTYPLDLILRGVWNGPLWEGTYPGVAKIVVGDGRKSPPL